MAADTSVVIIDDDPSALELLSEALKSGDVRLFTATDPERGIDIAFRERPQLVITDLVMPGINGLGVVERIAAFDPAIDVIVMTAHSSAESAVEAVQKGASDYLVKPVPVSMLRERISRLADETRRRHRGSALEGKLLATADFEGMIGKSAALFETSSRILRVAPYYRTALISGDTGTGKELAARALHALSPVSKGRFVVLNCSAVVETLFESELFGHVRGSFTGATQDKMGLFEYADKGTIFLDEIGDMPLGMQAKLLRTLQNQEVLRVGSLSPRKIDVRVIAATHRDLRHAIVEKQFRQDLYYRLSMMEIHVPSLAERKEDLPLLERHFLEKFCVLYRKKILGLTRRAEITLARHDWPGNIRELENAIAHACMMATSETIDVQDLPEGLRSQHRTQDVAERALPGESGLEAREKALIIKTLARTGGNQSEAARSLRMSRDSLRYRVRKFGLEPPPATKATHG
jgi:DNA-binding NtrC family response regulator